MRAKRGAAIECFDPGRSGARNRREPPRRRARRRPRPHPGPLPLAGEGGERRSRALILPLSRLRERVASGEAVALILPLSRSRERGTSGEAASRVRAGGRCAPRCC
jgi:hypothetical protein